MIHKITQENPPLTLDECKEIFPQIRELEKRDDKLSQLKYNGLVAKVILSVEGMIKTTAFKYANDDNTKINDFMSFGREGAFRALQNYDPENKYQAKYSSYAKDYITGAIKKHICDESRVGYEEVTNWKIYLDMANHIANISYAFTCREKRLPTYKELAGIMRVSPSTLIACIKMVDSHVKSINAPIKGDENEKEWQSKIPSNALDPYEETILQDRREKLQKVYENLSTRELNTLSMRFGLSDCYQISFNNTVNTYKMPAQKFESLKEELFKQTEGDPDTVFSIAGFFESNRAIYVKPNDDQKKSLGIGKN